MKWLLAFVMVAVLTFSASAIEIKIDGDGILWMNVPSTTFYQKTRTHVSPKISAHRVEILNAFENPGVFIPTEVNVSITKRINFLWLEKVTKVTQNIVYDTNNNTINPVESTGKVLRKEVIFDWFLIATLVSILLVVVSTTSFASSARSFVFFGAAFILLWAMAFSISYNSMMIVLIPILLLSMFGLFIISILGEQNKSVKTKWLCKNESLLFCTGVIIILGVYLI